MCLCNVCVFTTFQKVSYCQNNQFLWSPELNPNVKESINLSEDSHLSALSSPSGMRAADALTTL